MRWIALALCFVAGCASSKVQLSYSPPKSVVIQVTLEMP